MASLFNKKNKKNKKDRIEEKTVVLRKTPEVYDLDGEKVMVDFCTGKYFVLKGVANDIWDMLSNGVSVNYIIERLLENYQVSREICVESTGSFLMKLKMCEFIDLI